MWSWKALREWDWGISAARVLIVGFSAAHIMRLQRNSAYELVWEKPASSPSSDARPKG